MTYRPHGKAVVDSTDPSAFGVCDCCGIWWNLRDLAWQYFYAGPVLQNSQMLYCPTCLTPPNPNLQTIIIPPDPMPVMNARPENFVAAEVDFIVISPGNYILVDEDGNEFVANQNSVNFQDT